MPRHVQDAYTTVLSYMAKTSKTKDTISRIIQDRLAQLIEDQTLDVCAPRDIFSHLSRVQALLTYQTICLFDGDGNMTSLAEAHMSTLFEWSNDMLEATKLFSLLDNSTVFSCPDAALDTASVAWKFWILIESVRRCWLVANYVQRMYLFLKFGQSQCPGRVLFTMRQGLWDARSATAWREVCQNHGPLFVPIADNGILLDEINSDEVDPFGYAILTAEFGLETVQQWLMAK
jgi:hypothetical protein